MHEMQIKKLLNASNPLVDSPDKINSGLQFRKWVATMDNLAALVVKHDEFVLREKIAIDPVQEFGAVGFRRAKSHRLWIKARMYVTEILQQALRIPMLREITVNLSVLGLVGTQ